MLESNFGVVDVAIFTASLVLAVVVGIYYAYKDRTKNTLDNYYYAEKKISPIAIGMSCAVSVISSITVLSIPAMAYTQGTVMFWYFTANLLSTIPAALYFIPLIHRLQLPSIFDYLDLRFHSIVKQACSACCIFYQVIWMAVATYVTAIALNVVSPMSVDLSIVLTVIICTFYTTLGGIKAVIWVDTIQAFIMCAGVVAVAIKTSMEIGGVEKAIASMSEKGLNNYWSFNTNVTVTYTFWSVVVGLSPAWSSYYCTNQSITQRLQSCKSPRDARIAIFVSFVLTSAFMTLSILNGCLMFKYFEGCDPIASGDTTLPDQIIPLLVVRLFRDLPGVAGLFVAATYGGMLSTVSSGINSLSVLILEVFIRPVVSRPITNNRGMRISRFLGLVLGLLVMAATFFVQNLAEISMHMLTILDAIISGPMVGVYMSGILMPWTNKMGGLFGLLFGVSFNLWIIIGQMVWGKTSEGVQVERSTENCSTTTVATTAIYNFSDATTAMYNFTDATSLATTQDRPYLADTLYQVSLLFMGATGFLSTFIFAIIVSWITGFQKSEDADPRLFVPLVESSIFPKRIRRFFRFGVPQHRRSAVGSHKDELKTKDAQRRSETKLVAGRKPEEACQLVLDEKKVEASARV